MTGRIARSPTCYGGLHVPLILPRAHLGTIGEHVVAFSPDPRDLFRFLHDGYGDIESSGQIPQMRSHEERQNGEFSNGLLG